MGATCPACLCHLDVIILFKEGKFVPVYNMKLYSQGEGSYGAIES
jgi:hypothetical protein